MSVLTAQEQEDLVYVLGLAEDGENRVLDFSDERQYQAAIAMHNAGGHTPETRPGMHEALAETREIHLAQGGPGSEGQPTDGEFESGAQVTDVSTVMGSQNAAANGAAGVVNGALQLNSTIGVLDPNGKLLASGGGSQINQGEFLPLFADPVPGTVAQSQMTGSIFYSYQRTVGGPWTNGMVKRDVGFGVVADPVVIHPNKHQTGVQSPYIRIALGRGQNTQTDVDYWYWYQQNNTIYAIPWVGSVTFNAPPRPLGFNTTVRIYGTLFRGQLGSGGYAQLPLDAQQKLFNSLQPSGNTLAWTMAPPADKPPWGSTGNPIVWGDLRWQTGEADYVSIQLQVWLEGQNQPAAATVQSSMLPNSPQLDGTTNIPPLQFLWSCLTEGTPIRLADGSAVAIEEVVRGTAVACGDGQTREVSSTTIFNYAGEVLRLTTEDGRVVVLSHNHPVMTTEGPRQAHELEPGASLRVDGGVSALASAETEHYDGLLCNLSLHEAGVEAGADERTVFAAGIEVGDYDLQVRYDKAWRTDRERILSLLEPRYHEDYRHYLEEVAASA